MKTYSIRRAAELVGIHWMTLQRWVWQGRVKPSLTVRLNGRTLRRFTKAGIKRVRRYKRKHYWEGRGGGKKRQRYR